MTPAVSIVLATFNRLELLRSSVDSVLSQTFRDWELIIADDGSDEPTKRFLESLASPGRVRVLWLDHSGRPAVVRNAALREARGEYIAFQDSDDLWLPRKLEIQVASLRRNPERAWSHTRYRLVDVSGAPTAWMRRTGGWPTPAGWILDQLIRGETVIALPSVIASRRLLHEAGGFDERLNDTEDYELWLRLARRSEIDAVDELLTLVRRHGQHFSAKPIEAFQAARIVIDRQLRSGDVEHLRSVLLRQRARVVVGLARSRAAAGHRRDALATLVAGARYFWRYPEFWRDALAAIALTLMPRAFLGLLKRSRRWATPASFVIAATRRRRG
jgi:glycosyltransferase involved in cell wall biosynthesis